MSATDAQAQTQARRPADNARRAVLVADDEDDIRLLLEDILSPHYAVHTAEDGLEALEAVYARPGGFDLVITDLRMPRLDGLALLERLQAEYPGVGVIVISAHGTVDQAVRALKSGAVDYISKPLPTDLHEIYHKCERYFRLRRLEEERRDLQRQVADLARFPRSNPNFVARADLLPGGGAALYPGNERSAGILRRLGGRADARGRFAYADSWAFFPPDLCRTLRRIARRGEAVDIERHKADGRFYRHTYTPFADSEESVFLHVVDTTRQVRADQLRRSLEAGMEHEFKNLLSSITPQAELLQQGYLGPLAERQRQALGQIVRAGERLLDRLDERLRFSRAYAGELRLHDEEIDLYALAAEICADRGGPGKEIRLAGAPYDPGLPPPSVTAVCDPQYIGHVLNNLIGNALEHGPWVDTRIETTDDGVRVRVLDGGDGLDPGDLDGVWTLGYRAKNRRPDSSGIGLPYSKLVVEAHGGRIGAESGPGGSEFWFWLPRATPNRSPAPQP